MWGNTDHFHCSPSLLPPVEAERWVPTAEYLTRAFYCVGVTSPVIWALKIQNPFELDLPYSFLYQLASLIHSSHFLKIVAVLTKLYLKASNRKLLLGKLRFKHSVANNEPGR